MTWYEENKDWYESHDAALWALEFTKVVQDNPHLATDQSFVVGWIANAMSRGESRVYNMNDEEFSDVVNARNFLGELKAINASSS